MYQGRRVAHKRRHKRNVHITRLFAQLGAATGIVLGITLAIHCDTPETSTVEPKLTKQSSTVTVHQPVSTDSVEDNELVQEVVDPYDAQYAPGGREYPTIQWSKDWGAEDDYYLAKIIQCEAGICSMRGKIIHGLSILNRVHSDLAYYPDTIYEVIHQNDGQTWQYSPCMPDGSWWYTEPSEDAYEAVEHIKMLRYDISDGATSFEATGRNDTWHSSALQFLFEVDGVKFYKEW